MFIIIFGLCCGWRRQRRKAQARGEGYAGPTCKMKAGDLDDIDLPHPLIAIAPLLLVGC